MKITITKSELISRFNLPLGVEIEIEDKTTPFHQYSNITGKTNISGPLTRPMIDKMTDKGSLCDPTKYFRIEDDGKLKTSQLLAKCKEKFDCWSWNDKELDKEFPAPKKPTVRFFKKNQEADEELKNKSANDLEKEGVKGITLRERLLLELQYFNETGNHLDIENVTICSGSRSSDGRVPSVHWSADDRELDVSWSDTSGSGSSLRSRASINL